VLLALASRKHARGAGAGQLRELRDTIIGLLGEPGGAMCAECIAAALGQQVRVVIMTMLGFDDRGASLHGVCSSCHRQVRVIRRAV
jgi:hypothetical protein